jgi:bifunctional oligoribonuclease and PAP phosphatase NrnA
LVFGNIFYLYQAVNTKTKVTDLSKYTKELSKYLSTSGNILLISHINPDGDAIGSQLALYHFLKANGRTVGMIAPNYLQEFLKWMDGTGSIEVFIKDRKKCKQLIEEADLIILLDFNHSSRLGEAEDLVIKSKAKKIIIDHHPEPAYFTDMVISEPTRCSTSELIYELIIQLNGEKFLNRSYAEALYVGIVTDTGNFEHGSYSSGTFRIVADLLDTGIEKDKIHNLIYNNFSSDRIRLQGYALNKRMVVLPEFKTAYIYLSKEDMKEYNHVKGDTEGFVNMPLSIKGICFSVLFIEKDGFVKLSFRSKGQFPSNEFASLYFSGGGHINASGGEYKDTLNILSTTF